MVKVIVETTSGGTIENPKWNEVGRVHDWRNYVKDSYKKIWNDLPLVARACIMIMAEEQANDEDWD